MGFLLTEIQNRSLTLHLLMLFLCITGLPFSRLKRLLTPGLKLQLCAKSLILIIYSLILTLIPWLIWFLFHLSNS